MARADRAARGIVCWCECGRELLASRGLAGKNVSCPGCQSLVPVPGADGQAEAAATRAAMGDAPSGEDGFGDGSRSGTRWSDVGRGAAGCRLSAPRGLARTMLAARRPVRGLLVGRMFARAFCVGGLMMVFVGGLGLFAGSRIGVVEAVIGLAGVFLLAVAAVLWVLCGIGEWLQGLDGG